MALLKCQAAGKFRTPVPLIRWERVEDVNKLKQSTRLNMAACYLKLEEYQKCVDACVKALELGESVKAYFRRAQAYAELRNFGGATSDLERARVLAPDDMAIAVELRKVRNAFGQGGNKEKRQAAKMLAGVNGDERVRKAEAEAPDAVYVGPTVEEVIGSVEMPDVVMPDAEADAAGQHGSTLSDAPVAHVDMGRLDGVATDNGATADVPAISQGRVVQPVISKLQDEASKPDTALRQLTYAWHQSEDDIKIYISFDQSEELQEGVDESRVHVEYGEWNVLLVIRSAIEGRVPLGLRLGDFHRRIAPELCRCTVRNSRITLKLVKRMKEHWWNLLQHAPLYAA